MLLLFGFVFAGALFAAGPITDETVRLQALDAIFPFMFISLQAGQTIDSTRTLQGQHPLVFPDALAAEKVYLVTGVPTSLIEDCASAHPLTNDMVREVRLQLYPWPVGEGELLAVLQYRFPDAKPSTYCPSIGLLVHLIGEGAQREVLERLLLDSERHVTVQSIQMADLTGDGRPELIVESDSARENAVFSELHILDLSDGHFEALAGTVSRASVKAKRTEQWTQTLDIPRTLEQKGKRFCFVKTVYAEKSWLHPTPRETRVCYPRGQGVRH